MEYDNKWQEVNTEEIGRKLGITQVYVRYNLAITQCWI